MNNVRKDLKSVELAISNAQSARPKLMTVNNGEKLSTDALAHALSDMRNCILLLRRISKTKFAFAFALQGKSNSVTEFAL